MKQNIRIQALETKKKHKTFTKRNYKMQKLHKHAQKHTRMIMESEIIKSDLRPKLLGFIPKNHKIS
jgi:hypothetical protein